MEAFYFKFFARSNDFAALAGYLKESASDWH
jgi:hypothetical protein